MQFFLIILIVGLVLIIARMLIGIWKRSSEDKYWDGPKPTKLEQKRAKQAIFRHLEQFPNGELAKKNPEYVDEYVENIDLDLPPGVTTQN